MSPPDPLSPEALYRRCDPAQFDFASTAELAPLDGVIGQERALAALRFGIGIRHENYHLFALGPPGVGRHALVRQVLEERAAAEPVPSDWCYVHNFAEPHRPKAISLPAGRGKDFRRAIQELMDELRSAIPAAFESEDFGSVGRPSRRRPRSSRRTHSTSSARPRKLAGSRCCARRSA